ncbi:MAG: BtpA/SgcQ family protein [Oscillospiraceae bacterium]
MNWDDYYFPREMIEQADIIKNCQELWPLVDGAIIGSGFKRNGNLSEPIDKQLVKEFVALTENHG